MKKKTVPMFSSINKLIGAENIMRIVFEIDDYLSWVKKNHPNVKPTDILPGYKFFIESCIATFADSIHLDDSLKITEDYVYHRATHFADIPLNKIPTTCEKTAIIKNIQKGLRPIKRANSFDVLKEETTHFSDEILSLFHPIITEYVDLTTKLNLEQSKNFTSIFVAFTWLSDLSKGVPLGYLLSPLMKKTSETEFKNSFLGYKIGLQFLWSRLLSDKFGSSGIQKMHEAKDWQGRDDWLITDSSKEEALGTYLDDYFSIINNEVFDPIKNQWPNARNNYWFKIKGRSVKKVLKPLTVFEEKNHLTLEEKLKAELLWYNIELLESQSTIFNGVPAFNTLLAGVIEIKSKFANGEKAIICKIVHPVGPKKHDYSYGVLIESHSWCADYSGWIISFDCCGDYSGFAGTNHAMAEALIEHYQKQKKLIVRQFSVDKNEFKKFILNRITSKKKRDLISAQLEVANIKKISQEKLSESQGLILELISYYTLKNWDYHNVEWNFSESKKQIDLLCQSDDHIRIFECKVDPNNLDLTKEFEKIITKSKTLNHSKKVICQFLFFHQPSEPFVNHFKQCIQKFSQHGVVFEDFLVISEILKTDKVWRKKKLDKILNIFNSDFLKNSDSEKDGINHFASHYDDGNDTDFESDDAELFNEAFYTSD